MKKKDIVQLILLFIAFAFMIFSQKGEIKLIAAAFLLVYIIAFKLSCYRERKKLINEINSNKRTCMTYRENIFTFFLCAFTFIMNAITSISSIVHNKNMDVFLNQEKEISGFLDLISRFNFDEKINIFINIILIIFGIILAIEYVISVAVISDDKIIFYNGLIFEFSNITGLKYRDSLISKNKIIKIRKEKYEKEIVIKVEDFEKIKNYLESKISL